ncbi:hypothetical protein ACFWMG_04740 [Streptomyces sp. NPDC127074]|uniref:hypothetical protein n=1 Tax=Streptomyces sp. NPDC127074 TaxID=3347130 RepID=UPI00365D9653
MGVTFVVLAETEREVQIELQRMCDRLGLVPLGRPSPAVGRDRWMARAQVPAPQPQGGAGQE